MWKAHLPSQEGALAKVGGRAIQRWSSRRPTLKGTSAGVRASGRPAWELPGQALQARTYVALTSAHVTSRHASTSLSPIANLCSRGILATRSTTQCVTSSMRSATTAGLPSGRAGGFAPGPPQSPPAATSSLIQNRDQGFENQGSRDGAKSSMVSAITKRMHPSGRGGHPYGLKDAANTYEGCTHPAIAEAHQGSWLRASRREALPLGLEACGHAPRWTSSSRHEEAPFRESRTPMGPHGHKETTRRMHRSEKGMQPSGPIDSRKRREGAALRASHQAMCPHRRADQPEGSSDPRGRPLPLVSSIPSSTGEPYSISRMRDSLRALGVGARHEGLTLVRTARCLLPSP